jgi:hypothetical protein
LNIRARPKVTPSVNTWFIGWRAIFGASRGEEAVSVTASSAERLLKAAEVGFGRAIWDFAGGAGSVQGSD